MRALWLQKKNRRKEAGHGNKGPTRALANNLLSCALGKPRNYPTARLARPRAPQGSLILPKALAESARLHQYCCVRLARSTERQRKTINA